MTADEKTAPAVDLAEILGMEDVADERWIDLRRKVHCSILLHDDLARLLEDFKAVTKRLSSENKAELFSALIADERKHGKRDFHLDPDSPDIAGDLRGYGRSLIAYISRARNIQSVRTVMAIAEKFPKVGQDFYRDGPQRGIDYLRGYIEAQARAGRLVVEDSTMAARQLQQLFHVGIINELLYGIRETPDAEEIARVTDEAVETFLARYQPGRD